MIFVNLSKLLELSQIINFEQFIFVNLSILNCSASHLAVQPTATSTWINVNQRESSAKSSHQSLPRCASFLLGVEVSYLNEAINEATIPSSSSPSLTIFDYIWLSSLEILISLSGPPGLPFHFLWATFCGVPAPHGKILSAVLPDATLLHLEHLEPTNMGGYEVPWQPPKSGTPADLLVA